MDLNLTQAPAQLTALGAMSWAWAAEFLPRLGVAILILIAGFTVAGWASRVVRLAIERSRHIDSTLEPIAATAVRYTILIVVLTAGVKVRFYPPGLSPNDAPRQGPCVG